VVAPVPPRRPDDIQIAVAREASPSPLPAEPAPRLVAMAHPLPPERPRTPGAAGQFGLAAAPAPATSAAVVTASPAREAASRPGPATTDRRALEQLFAAVALGPAPSAPPKVTQTRARAAQTPVGTIGVEGAPAAALGFSQRDPNDTRSDRFSGPAVRPLPTTYTSR
jgi:hypothetical protein